VRMQSEHADRDGRADQADECARQLAVDPLGRDHDREHPAPIASVQPLTSPRCETTTETRLSVDPLTDGRRRGQAADARR